MKPTACASLTLVLLVLLLTTSAPAAKPPSAPRYRFEVGQELEYVGSSRFNFPGGAHGSRTKTTFWVVRLNDDQSWHIIAHSEDSFSQMRGAENEPLPEGDKEEAFDAFALFPDGRVANPPQGYREKYLPNTFILLPADLPRAKAGWQQEREAGDVSLYRLAATNDPAAGKWLFERTEQGLFNEVYLSTDKAMIHFDANRGLIIKIESENTQGYGFNGKGTGLIELKSVRIKDPEWLTQFSRETDTLLKAKAAVQAAFKTLKQGGDRDQIISATEKLLRDSQDQVKLPLVVVQFNRQQAQFKSSASNYAKEQQREADVLNKPAAEWSTEDIDGKKHSLAGHRGKVIVLDFWYRGCGWCIKAMPQIKKVVEHYQGQPVVVLGMNTDREEKDARFVVDKLKLNYATLKAEGLPEKYGVQGFPTLIVIDQNGFVRGRHVGYSATLREELIKQIDGLLVKSP